MVSPPSFLYATPPIAAMILCQRVTGTTARVGAASCAVDYIGARRRNIIPIMCLVVGKIILVGWPDYNNNLK